jgi:hypothetical protein
MVQFLVFLECCLYDRHNPLSARHSKFSLMHFTKVCWRDEPVSGFDVFDNVRQRGAGMTTAATRTDPTCAIFALPAPSARCQ